MSDKETGQETPSDIVDWLLDEDNFEYSDDLQVRGDWTIDASGLAMRLNIAIMEDTAKIERIVRDAIISYLEWYPSVPNDEAEAELKQRAETASAWLVSHGFKQEAVTWSKEEVSPF